MSKESYDEFTFSSALFEDWVPQDQLLRIRSSEDGFRQPVAPDSFGGESTPKNEPTIPLEMYIELISAIIDYARLDPRRDSKKGLPNTHRDWIALIDTLTAKRKSEVAKKISAGAKVAIPEQPWQRSIVEQAWHDLTHDENRPGWSKLRNRCRDIAKKDGRSRDELDLFSEHYCKRKVRLMRGLSAVRAHKKNKKQAT